MVPYIELMVGAYSDNQPDYSWLQPYETKAFEMYWYPFRDIGGVKKANLEAAVNLEVKTNGMARVGFCTTSAHRAARMLLQAGVKVLLDETVSISPAKAFVKTVTVPAGLDEHELRASISVEGRELVAYSPVRLEPAETPKPVQSPPSPKDVKTIEELYLAGQRIEQFHSPGEDPEPYWEEALRRDPGDARVNTALGIRLFKQARFVGSRGASPPRHRAADAELYLPQRRRAVLLPGIDAPGPVVGPRREKPRASCDGGRELAA